MRDFSDAGKDPEKVKARRAAERQEERSRRAEKRRREVEAYEGEEDGLLLEQESELSIEDQISAEITKKETEERKMRKKKKKADPKRRKRRRIIGFSVLGVLLVLVGLLLLWLWPRAPGGINTPPTPGGSTDPSDSTIPDSMQEQIAGDTAQREGVYTFLLGGTDEDGTRTDVLMTVTLDTVDGSIKLLSIPRDSMVRANTSTGVRKINSAFGTKAGIEATKEAVARVTGYYVNRYVVVDLDGFVELIDAVGGVWYDVPRDMYYVDPTQDLYIDLKKGHQLLDGEKAIQLVRFRKGYYNQDLGRIETTQGFLKALFDTLIQPKNLLKLQSFAKLLIEDTQTDLTVSELVWLATKASKIDPDKIETFIAPGTSRMVYGASYIVLNEKEMLKLINEHMNPLEKPITDLDIVTAGTLTPTPKPTPSVSPEATPSVSPEATPSVSPEATPSVSPEATPSVSPEATPSVSPEATPSVSPEATPSVPPEPTPEATATPKPTNSPTPAAR